MELRQIKPKHIKISLFITILIMLGVILAFYCIDIFSSKKIVSENIKIDSKASLVLKSMQHTSTRNGIKEWTLEASSATVLKQDAEALLKDIVILFFLKDGETVKAAAKEGYIETKEQNIGLSNSVIIKYGSSILTTDQLHYEKKSHIIFSKNHVRITNNKSIVDSDSMTINLNDNTILLKGNVTATLHLNTNLNNN